MPAGCTLLLLIKINVKYVAPSALIQDRSIITAWLTCALWLNEFVLGPPHEKVIISRILTADDSAELFAESGRDLLPDGQWHSINSTQSV